MPPRRGRGAADPEQERGEKIIRQMERLERKPRRRALSCAPWLIALFLAVVITAIILVNRDRFAPAWRHLTRPDSIPGISP